VVEAPRSTLPLRFAAFHIAVCPLVRTFDVMASGINSSGAPMDVTIEIAGARIECFVPEDEGKDAHFGDGNSRVGTNTTSGRHSRLNSSLVGGSSGREGGWGGSRCAGGSSSWRVGWTVLRAVTPLALVQIVAHVVRGRGTPGDSVAICIYLAVLRGAAVVSRPSENEGEDAGSIALVAGNRVSSGSQFGDARGNRSGSRCRDLRRLVSTCVGAELVCAGAVATVVVALSVVTMRIADEVAKEAVLTQWRAKLLRKRICTLRRVAVAPMACLVRAEMVGGSGTPWKQRTAGLILIRMIVSAAGVGLARENEGKDAESVWVVSPMVMIIVCGLCSRNNRAGVGLDFIVTAVLYPLLLVRWLQLAP